MTFRALALRRRANARNVSFQSLYGGQFTLSIQLINKKFCVSLPDRRSTTVSLETNPLATESEPCKWYTPISIEGFASFCLPFAHTVDQPISRPWKWQTTARHYNQNNWVLKKTNPLNNENPQSTVLTCLAQLLRGGEGAAAPLSSLPPLPSASYGPDPSCHPHP